MSSVLLHNPDRKNKDEFIAEFVIRTKIFEEMWADIVSGKMKTPEQHYLLLGQRGAGKTTLLLRLKYAVEDDEKLSQWLIPVMFGEEQYNIGELGNLWERIAEYLEDYHGFKGITEEIAPFVLQDNYEEAALKVLVKHLDQHKKKVILLIDNIGQLLAKFSQLEVHRLREVLQTIPHFRLVAGSPVTLESVLDYQQPLFEFFKVIQLKGLTDEESITLLRQLAVIHHEETKIERIIKESPSRITTLRTLSGGVPRTMALLFQVFADSEHGTALSDLENVLDAVTPFYKHQMDDLPAQQQKIIDAVALHWEAISVKDLVKQVRLDSKLVSAQLRQLEKNQVIEKRSTQTKNHVYLLQERFFNIWYLMRYGRKRGRGKVIWLVKLFETWCDKREIENRVKDYIRKVKQGLLDQNTLEVYGYTYTFFESITPETKFLLRDSTPEYIASNVVMTEEEFYRLLDRALKKDDHKSFIQIVEPQKLIAAEERERFYKYVLANIDKVEHFIAMDNAEERLTIPFLFYTVFLLRAINVFTRFILEDKYESIEGFVDMFGQRLAMFENKSFNEIVSFDNVMALLLAAEYNEFAVKLITESGIDEKSKQLWNYIIDFFKISAHEGNIHVHANSDSNPVQPPEIDWACKIIIEHIFNVRKYLKEGKKAILESKKG